MKRLAFLLALSVTWACSSSPTAPPPPPPLDPPAAVHVVNTSGQSFDAWTVVLGADLNHSGLALQGTSDLAHPGTLCLRSGSTTGERRFAEVAVAVNSALDSALLSITGHTAAWADSVRQGLISLSAWLTAHPGLIAATPPFDPAPASWPPPGWPVAAPNDTVPFTWTVSGVGSTTIAIDTTDHACY